MSIYFYIKSGSARKGAAILRRHVSRVTQNVDLLGVWGFYPDITAGIRHMGQQKMRINIRLAFSK